MQKLVTQTGSAGRPGDIPHDAGTIVVSRQPGAIIDFSAVDGTTLMALGAGDQIGLNTDPDGSSATGDTILAAGNRTTVNLGSSTGNDVFLLGRDDVVTGMAFPGSADTIIASSSDARITVGGNNSILLKGTDAHVTVLPTLVADSMDPFGDNSVVASGAGKATVTGAGSQFSFSGDTGHYTVSGGGAEHVTISGGSGGGLFTGGYFQSSYQYGPPGDQHFLYSGDNTITAGSLGSTLVGAAHGSSVLIAAGNDRDVLMAGEYGNDTLSGGNSTASNIYEGYLGKVAATDDPAVPSLVINAGSGNDTLIGGQAAETLTGGAGRDQFRFVSGEVGAKTLITDFTPGTDKIDLRGYNVTSEQVVASATISGGSTIFNLPGGSSITLLHITDLSAKDFTHS